VTGIIGYNAGLCAEEIVTKRYAACGFSLAKSRWRGRRGEIDLIAERDGELVFVEVKKSKTCASAATRLSERQQSRIYGAAEEYLATRTGDRFPDCRFDVALVDQIGRVEILENAFGHH